MIRKPLHLPSEVARAFVKDMQAYFDEENPIRRDGIVVYSSWANWLFGQTKHVRILALCADAFADASGPTLIVTDIALTKCLNKIWRGRLYFEERRCSLMTTVGTVYPAQVLVVEAEIRLVADQTQNAAPVTIKTDEQAVIEAEEIAKPNSLIDIVA
jgi:hypothetical protein